MSQQIIEQLKAEFGDKVLQSQSFRGDDEAVVAPEHWWDIARFLHSGAPDMKQFVDLTAADYPEREPEIGRFDLLLMLRSMQSGQRIRVKTRVRAENKIRSVVPLWKGANWAEREVYDMFGIVFDQHPDLRRILMYEQFEGYPLRKDYPIQKTQPLVEYRKVAGIDKIEPFGDQEGQPWNRINWIERLQGKEKHVSPAVAVMFGEKRALSDSEENAQTEEQEHGAG